MVFLILSFSDCLTCFAAAFALCLKLRCANRKPRQKFRQKNRFIWNFVIHFKNLLLFQTLLSVNMHQFFLFPLFMGGLNCCRRLWLRPHPRDGDLCEPACGGHHLPAAHALLHGEASHQPRASGGHQHLRGCPGQPVSQLERRRRLHRDSGRTGGKDRGRVRVSWGGFTFQTAKQPLMTAVLLDPPSRAALLWQAVCAKQPCFTASGCWLKRPRDTTCWPPAPTEKPR